MTGVTPLGDVVATWQTVRASAGRLDKRAQMAALFARLSGDDLRLAASYLSGDLASAPPGVGWAALQEALRAVGETAGAALTLDDVDRTFAELVATSGAGAQRRRGELLGALLGRAAPAEREFLAGLITGELRQGALRALVLEALALARGLDAAALRRAVMHAGSLAEVLAAVERGGSAALGEVTLRPLVPVEPMLASTAGDLAEALAELGGSVGAVAAAQARTVGESDSVRIFTRSLRDVTEGAPELLALARALPVDSVILDGEAIARGDGELPVPFQDLMSEFQEKGRAGGRLQAMFFDILYQDGEPLVDRPDRERRARLEALLPASLVIPRRVVADVPAIAGALDEAIAAGHEGLVLKDLESPYAAGRRGSNWRKVKRAVTLDLVILAAEWGHGRRRGLLSNLHLGARDATDVTRFWMLGKTFKGLTDRMLREQTESLLAIAVDKTEWVVRVRPELVVEIAFDAVLRSRRYDSGLALRFARVKRFRPDKLAAQATTIDEIRKLSVPQQ